MKGKKNDFSITFYNGEEKRLFMEFVQDTNDTIRWMKRQGIEWTHGMLYERRTRRTIGRLYPDGRIDEK